MKEVCNLRHQWSQLNHLTMQIQNLSRLQFPEQFIYTYYLHNYKILRMTTRPYKHQINKYQYPHLRLEVARIPSWKTININKETLNRHRAILTYFYLIFVFSFLTQLSTFDCHDSPPIISLILQSQIAIIRNQLKENRANIGGKDVNLPLLQ